MASSSSRPHELGRAGSRQGPDPLEGSSTVHTRTFMRRALRDALASSRDSDSFSSSTGRRPISTGRDSTRHDDSDRSLVFVEDEDDEEGSDSVESPDRVDAWITDEMVRELADASTNDSIRQIDSALGSGAETGSHDSAQGVVEEDFEPRRCWICFSFETEDPQPAVWRTPCPCALTAHDACLLDWIADLEAPNSSARIASTRQVKCPQCQHKIVVERPRSLLVDLVQKATKTVRMMFFPAAALAVAGPIYLGLATHGMWSIYTVFGYADAERILGPLRIPAAQQAALMAPGQSPLVELGTLLRHGARCWRYALGLPIIPIVLVLNRSNLLDNYLPLSPLIMLALRGRMLGEVITKSTIRYTLSPPSLSVVTPKDVGPLWPPSPALCFALLPYVRVAYNALHSYLVGDLERQWLREVQPRHQTEAAMNDPDGEQIGREEGGILQLDVELGAVLDEDEAEEEIGVEPGRLQGLHRWMMGEQARPDQQGADAEGQDPQEPQLQEQNQNINQALNAARNVRQNNNLVLRTSLMESILGSLLFPAIATSFGEILRLLLPYAWTHVPGAAAAAAAAVAKGATAAAGGGSAGSSTLFSIYAAATAKVASAVDKVGLSGAAEPLVSAAHSAASVGHKAVSAAVSALTGGSSGGSGPVATQATAGGATAATTTGAGAATGLLQLRWGRALVGGCLAVLLKDSIMLYVRWRLAQNQRLRRIVDYKESKARVRAGRAGSRTGSGAGSGTGTGTGSSPARGSARAWTGAGERPRVWIREVEQDEQGLDPSRAEYRRRRGRNGRGEQGDGAGANVRLAPHARAGGEH